MLEIDCSQIYDKAHGDRQDKLPDCHDSFALVDTTDERSVRDVCKKLLEFWQAFENLRQSVRNCGDCVRFTIPRSSDAMSRAAMLAALADDGPMRCIYMSCDDNAKSTVTHWFDAATNIGSYVKRMQRRLRRPA